jgi:hypothetical protein
LVVAGCEGLFKAKSDEEEEEEEGLLKTKARHEVDAGHDRATPVLYASR